MCRLNSLFRTAGLTLLLVAAAQGQGIEYKPIPAGFDFPADEQTLLTALQQGDEPKLRTHGWMVFAGLTQPTRPNEPDSEALWETWYTGGEVFSAGPAPQGDRTLERRLTKPRQFGPQGGAQPQAVGESQLAFTLFNQELKDHTRSNKLHLTATLKSINSSWTNQTPIKDRKVADYPREAMSLKLVWMAVKKSGMTPLPIWDQQAIVATAPPQDTDTWKRKVVVDPSRTTIPAGETVNVPGFPGSKVVPLSAFYHFTLNANQASDFGASSGDHAVLVGMHYTTKEIPDWVWATFWWHDRPDDGPFAKDRPDASRLKGVWRNYLMDVAYSMDIPKESNGTANAVFNPWLEARFPNGVNSNCMTCHQRAVWSEATPVPPFLPVTRGAAPDNAPIFANGTKVDFLWSLLMEGNQP
jgi:hypothetical protein